ncbi:hypothetical protein BDV95DRAFT_602990 [Massariosphaeria phaeospora]|uniref:Uncharacterized protein n=1 Tax=Massariosphaeria phaeospora TaxID=100035 RepID=A0A7C8MFU5_9PLEO|nr:hypothetical protein BDV95DRAFT_602990 [Massariosphaeria phaeospora]
MAEPLSLAASIFAVAGAADVVVRASVECCRFLSAITGAPADIECLRGSIEENQLLAQNLRQYLIEVNTTSGSSISAPASAASSPDLRDALKLFYSAIKALRREFGELDKLGKKYSGPNRMWGRIKFVLDERKIRQHMTRLQSSKSTIANALALISERQSSLAHTKTHSIMQQGFQRTTTHIDARAQQISSIQSTQTTIVANQVQAASQRSTQTHSLRKQIITTGQVSQKEHRKTRAHISKSKSDTITTLNSKFNELSTTMMSRAPVAAPISNREIQFFGESLDSIMLPLLILRGHIRETVMQIVSQSTRKISSHHVYWLQSELENLVSSATQEIAARSAGSTATPFDRWDYSGEAKNTPKSTAQRTATVSEAAKWQGVGDNSRSARRKRPKYEVFQFENNAGRLEFSIPHQSDVLDEMIDLDNVRFSFVPAANICGTAFTASFSKAHEPEPRLCAQINAYILVKDSILYSDLFSSGTLQEIDSALRDGTISPYGLDGGRGNICLYHAALYGRCDMLEYLDSQGIGLSTQDGYNSAFMGLWKSYNSRFTTSLLDYNRTLAYLMKRTGTCLSSIPLSPLVVGDLLPVDLCDQKLNLAKKYMQFLQVGGYGLEQQDGDGCTLLLQTLVWYNNEISLALCRELLDRGADVGATDHDGWNAINWALWSPTKSSSSVEEKLSLVIERGADIHHRTKKGVTPSHFARCEVEYDCWNIWCWALERNGLDVRDVVDEDEKLWLLDPERCDQHDCEWDENGNRILYRGELHEEEEYSKLDKNNQANKEEKLEREHGGSEEADRNKE